MADWFGNVLNKCYECGRVWCGSPQALCEECARQSKKLEKEEKSEV